MGKMNASPDSTRPALSPVSIVAILVIIAGAIWLQQRVAHDNHGVVRELPPTAPYTVQDRSHPGVVAAPEGRRVMTPGELKLHREDLRNRLIGLMAEAEDLSHQGAADRAAGRPDSSFARISEIQIALKPIAADTVFPDIQAAATNAIESLKVNQVAPIQQALKDVKALPPP